MRSSGVAHTIAKLTALLFSTSFLMSCKPSVEITENPCEVRIYQQQVLMALSKNNSKSGGVPSLASNPIVFQGNIGSDLWLILDYVRVKQEFLLSAPKTPNYKKISPETTFLIVAADDPSTYDFQGRKFFDGDYAHLEMHEACPIYIGRRNGKFALATVRKIGGKRGDERQSCDIYATLTYFGISKERLSDYSDFIEIDPLGLSYDFNAIRTELEAAKSCGRSIDDFHLAAEQGNSDAQYRLGTIYLSGYSGLVQRDDIEAFKWLRLAADQGYLEAQSLLGFMYDLRGEEIKALKWYRLAAAQGDQDAQFQLSQIYADGKGVEKNFIRSYQWISVAIRNLDEGRQKKWMENSKAKIEAMMTKDEIDRAEKFASKCVESNFQDCQ